MAAADVATPLMTSRPQPVASATTRRRGRGGRGRGGRGRSRNNAGNATAAAAAAAKKKAGLTAHAGGAKERTTTPAAAGIKLPASEYVEYTHQGGGFAMAMPRRGVPWHDGGWVQYVDSTMYDRECRCGVVRRAVYFHASGTRGPDVALKVLDRAKVAHAIDSWQSEVAMMGKLQPRGLTAAHRRCPQMPLWDYRAVDGEPNVYIATEWADGGTLQSWALKHVQRLRAANLFSVWFEKALPRLAHQLLSGLAAMHACGRGVAHLDLDPVNIVMTSPDLDTAEVRFIDFGSAREVDTEGCVGDEGIKWKFQFCAPEIHRFWARQIESFDGRAADMFSAAAILWWLIALPPACLFDDMRSSTIVDIQKLWLSNLMSHSAGLHTEQAAARAKQALQAANADADVALQAAAAARETVVAVQRKAAAIAHSLRALPMGPARAAAEAQLQAAMQQYNTCVAGVAEAEERVRTTQLFCAELREGRRVVLPFQAGECLCCRWGFKIPPQWSSLLVHALLRDRTPAPRALVLLQRDVPTVSTLVAAATSSAPPPTPVVSVSGSGGGMGAGAGAMAGTPVGQPAAVPPPLPVTSNMSHGGVARDVAEAVLLSDAPLPPPPPPAPAAAPVAVATAGAGAGFGALPSATPTPVAVHRQRSLPLSLGVSLQDLMMSGGPLLLSSDDSSPEMDDERLLPVATSAANPAVGTKRASSSSPLAPDRPARVRRRTRYLVRRSTSGHAIVKSMPTPPHMSAYDVASPLYAGSTHSDGGTPLSAATPAPKAAHTPTANLKVASPSVLPLASAAGATSAMFEPHAMLAHSDVLSLSSGSTATTADVTVATAPTSTAPSARYIGVPRVARLTSDTSMAADI